MFKFLLIIIVSLTSFQQQDFKIRPKQFTKPSNSGDCSVALSYLWIYIVFLLLFPLCVRLCVWNELNFSAYLHFQFIFATIYESYCTFWYYSWVSLHFLIQFVSPTMLFSFFFFFTLSSKSFQFQLNKLFQTDSLSLSIYIYMKWATRNWCTNF